jgi:hypothetical protein
MIVDELDEERWSFYGFESPREGRPVQAWIGQIRVDRLDDHLFAIKDQLAMLQVTPRSEWDQPLFDPLWGEGGISEIRFDPIKCERGKFYYRIYGVFDEESAAYIFLHATNKQRRNDKHGKAIAKRRLGELRSGEATTHEIDLE